MGFRSSISVPDKTRGQVYYSLVTNATFKGSNNGFPGLHRLIFIYAASLKEKFRFMTAKPDSSWKHSAA